MEQILVYADSLSWGIIPDSRQRLPFEQRWPGVFENTLNGLGKSVRVVENCLNGRRTVWSDPFRDGRDGSDGLAQVIEMHSPLKLVVLMLGTNDFQAMHTNNAWLSAQGIVKLIQIIRQAPVEPGMPVPEIMVVAPPKILKPKGLIAGKFEGAELKDHNLAAEQEKVATELGTHFFDANTVTSSSEVDGIHLDAAQHLKLGQALAQQVTDIAIL